MRTLRPPTWLSDPTESEQDRAAFVAYTRSLAARWWPWLGLLVAASALVWWPLDRVVYPDAPQAQGALAWLRTRLIVLDVGLALLLPRLAVARSHPHVVALLAAWGNLAMAGWCLAQLDPGGVLGIAYAYLVPLFGVLLLVPLPQRVFASISLSATIYAAWLAHPATSLDTPGALASLSFLAFSTILAVFVGHVAFGLLRHSFHLGLQLERQRSAFEDLAEHLEQRVAEQTRAVRTLHAKARDLRTAQRHTLARDLHDQIGQDLLSLRLLVGLGRQLQGTSALDETFEELDGQVERTQKSLRRVLESLRPTQLAEHGLVEGLAALMADLERRSGVRFTLTTAEVPTPLPGPVSLALFQMAQEGFHNALRHARARQVRLRVVADAAGVHLSVEDDGRGMPPDGVGSGMGTVGIAERAAELGGSAHWRSVPEGGTRLEITLPPAEPA